MYRIAATITSHAPRSGVGGRQWGMSVTTTTRTRGTTTPRSPRRWLTTTVDKKSTVTTTTTTTTTNPATASPSGSTSGPMEFKNAAQKHEYLKAANAEMERYHHAREMLRQGKLKSKNNGTGAAAAGGGGGVRPSESSSFSTGMAQLGVVTLFLVAFMATPLIGKKIAKDEEFRKKWVPSWYDFTVPKPENPWTREELHEQMIEAQREIRERAIRGEFSKDKLEELQETLEGQYTGHRAIIPQTAIRKEWARIHPGLEEGEEVHEG